MNAPFYSREALSRIIEEKNALLHIIERAKEMTKDLHENKVYLIENSL